MSGGYSWDITHYTLIKTAQPSNHWTHSETCAEKKISHRENAILIASKIRLWMWCVWFRYVFGYISIFHPSIFQCLLSFASYKFILHFSLHSGELLQSYNPTHVLRSNIFPFVCTVDILWWYFSFFIQFSDNFPLRFNEWYCKWINLCVLFIASLQPIFITQIMHVICLHRLVRFSFMHMPILNSSTTNTSNSWQLL